jgi:hypothetical protein
MASHMLNELLHEVVEEICRENVSHSESERMNGLGKDCNCENIVNHPAMGEVNNEMCYSEIPRGLPQTGPLYMKVRLKKESYEDYPVTQPEGSRNLH